MAEFLIMGLLEYTHSLLTSAFNSPPKSTLASPNPTLPLDTAPHTINEGLTATLASPSPSIYYTPPASPTAPDTSSGNFTSLLNIHVPSSPITETLKQTAAFAYLAKDEGHSLADVAEPAFAFLARIEAQWTSAPSLTDLSSNVSVFPPLTATSTVSRPFSESGDSYVAVPMLFSRADDGSPMSMSSDWFASESGDRVLVHEPIAVGTSGLQHGDHISPVAEPNKGRERLRAVFYARYASRNLHTSGTDSQDRCNDRHLQGVEAPHWSDLALLEDVPDSPRTEQWRNDLRAGTGRQYVRVAAENARRAGWLPLSPAGSYYSEAILRAVKNVAREQDAHDDAEDESKSSERVSRSPRPRWMRRSRFHSFFQQRAANTSRAKPVSPEPAGDPQPREAADRAPKEPWTDPSFDYHDWLDSIPGSNRPGVQDALDATLKGDRVLYTIASQAYGRSCGAYPRNPQYVPRPVWCDELTASPEEL